MGAEVFMVKSLMCVLVVVAAAAVSACAPPDTVERERRDVVGVYAGVLETVCDGPVSLVVNGETRTDFNAAVSELVASGAASPGSVNVAARCADGPGSFDGGAVDELFSNAQVTWLAGNDDAGVWFGIADGTIVEVQADGVVSVGVGAGRAAQRQLASAG